jgi:large subunit ribosomal protein L17
MRHRKKGRHLGRTSSHRKALLRNLASSLFLTERDAEFERNVPKVKGRIVTTLHKAKEVRPLVERCITIARKSLVHVEAANKYATRAQRGTDEWKRWRKSDQWKQWNTTIAPAVAARRRALRLLGDKQAVGILFADIAPRFADRPGGYTRILKLAKPRLGDAGPRAILELVGKNDRVVKRSPRPAFETAGAAENRGGASDDQ